MTRREKLKEEADLLRAQHEDDPSCWFVGRTDIQSYTCDGQPEHYAYGPDPIRVRFVADDGDDALEQAIEFAKRVGDSSGTVTLSLL